MNDGSCKTCRFCLAPLNEGEWNEIDEATKQTLNMLLLKSKHFKNSLDISKENVICKECTNKLQSALNFKSMCISSENKISPHPRSEDFILKEKSKNDTSEELINASDDHKLCRCCKKLKEYECYSHSQEKMENKFILDMVRTYIPELHLGAVEDLITCRNCLDSLQVFLNFIITCLGFEEKIHEDVEVKLELDDIQETEVITDEEIEEKYVESERVITKDEAGYEFVDIGNLQVNVENVKNEDKSEENHDERIKYNVPQSEKCVLSNLEEDTAEISMFKCALCPFKAKSKYYLKYHLLKHKDPSEVKMYNCESCSFQSMYKHRLQRHLLKHKDNSEATVYKCDSCSYQTKRKDNLKIHLLKHMDPSKVTIYKCDSCSFQTKREYCIKKHFLIHKTSLEATVYKCDSCSFLTNHKESLTRHVLMHKDPSEVTMYKCDSCPYQTTIKYRLKKHFLIHKDPSKVTTYKCYSCSFQTKFKNHLKNHELKHKDPSEVKMYKCDSCSFETKRKHCLGRHFLKHKNPSEVTMYKCDSCSYETKYDFYLKKHSLIHTDSSEIIMYKCDTCSFQTESKHCLKRHLLSHKNSSLVCIVSISNRAQK